MSVALFLELCQILAAMGTAGVAFLAIEKDLKGRIAAGTLKPADPLPAEHAPAVYHRLEHGLEASDDVWNETHAPEGG
jgi:hypothetical protein